MLALALAPLPLAPVALAAALTTWPHAELERLAPLVAHADVACVESNPDGTMKQVTLLAWVPVAPAVMRDVIVRTERYREFVPNLSKSTNEPLADGRWQSRWKIELPVSSFEGTNVYALDGEAVVVKGEGKAQYRYEMLPVGEGTLLVQYGFTDVRGSNAFVRAFVKRQPMMEHGLALSAQMMFVTAMRQEAVRRAAGAADGAKGDGAKGDGAKADGAKAVKAPAGAVPSFAPLLARGQVAVMRADEVSVVDRVYASEAKVAEVIGKGGEYAAFVPGVEKSYRRDDGGLYVEMSLPIVTWASTWMVRRSEHAVDEVAVDGDLRGARVRWDLSTMGGAKGAGAAEAAATTATATATATAARQETMVVWRARQVLEQGSLVLRKLFAFQPSLRVGINVALGLVWMRAVRGRAEGWR